jgi:hypothetical protein
MEVFISWSGPRSGAVATALKAWLPLVVNALKPFLSSADIDKGARWGKDIAEHLQAAKAGIVCLTPSNIRSDWLLFEAGALSKTVDNTFVCTLLDGLEPSDIDGPLTQFQATRTNKDDLLKLVKTLNRALGEEALGDFQVQEAFEALWPKLETELKKLPSDEPRARPERSERDILEEILNLVRNQSRSSGGTFIGEDFQKALAERASNALMSSGLVSGFAMFAYPDKILFRVTRKDGGNRFEVAIPTSAPLEAVENIVRIQLPLQQSPPPPPNAAPAQAPPPRATLVPSKK